MGLPPGSLAKQNDSGRSFEKIADHIESIASPDSVIKFPMES